MVEKRINAHFGGVFSEITTLPSADYLYVARLISDSTGEIMDERVLDMVIERKNVQDVCQCLITDSKKYKPLSFFEAQMYKLQNCGMSKKLFVMEGDEDKAKNLFRGAKSQAERERRLKRVKTLR
jgi:ERCC4-type nuclease